VVTVVRRKTVVEYLVDGLGRSERRACALTLQPRSTQRFDSTRHANPRLQERLVSLASERRRFGYPRLHMMLRREGFAVGRRRIYRLYRTLGLKLRSKRRRHGAQLLAAGCQHRRRPTSAGRWISFRISSATERRSAC
jgi:putative transposase